jgi:hypothetical protein
MGQENSGTDQTHYYCRHCLKHFQRPLRHCATENGGHLAQSKRFPGTNTQSRSTEDSAQQALSIPAIISLFPGEKAGSAHGTTLRTARQRAA